MDQIDQMGLRNKCAKRHLGITKCSLFSPTASTNGLPACLPARAYGSVSACGARSPPAHTQLPTRCAENSLLPHCKRTCTAPRTRHPLTSYAFVARTRRPPGPGRPAHAMRSEARAPTRQACLLRCALRRPACAGSERTDVDETFLDRR